MCLWGSLLNSWQTSIETLKCYPKTINENCVKLIHWKFIANYPFPSCFCCQDGSISQHVFWVIFFRDYDPKSVGVSFSDPSSRKRGDLVLKMVSTGCCRAQERGPLSKENQGIIWHAPQNRGRRTRKWMTLRCRGVVR